MLEQVYKVLIPDDIKKNILAYPYAKNFIGACVIAFFASPGYALLYYYLGFYSPIYVILSAEFLMLLSLVALKFFHSLWMANAIFISILFGELCWLMYYLGGINSSTSYWLVLPPLLAAFTGGIRSGFFWCFVSIIIASIFYFLQLMQFPFPVPHANYHFILFYTGISGLCLVIILMAYFYEAGKKSSLQKLHYLAYNDNLTGLPNQISFHENLTRYVSSGSSRLISIIHFGIDNFNKIKAIFGDEVGDKLLLQIVSRTKRTLGQHGFITRFDTNSFKIIIANSDVDTIRNLTDMLFLSINSPYYIQQQEIHIDFSMGVAMLSMNDKNVAFIDRYANMALEKSRSLGGNNLQYFDEVLAHESAMEIKIEKLLPTAIQNNELSVYFQPQFDTKQRNKIIGLEALLRWHHKELGDVLPSLFIPVAERIGIVSQLDEWILREACRQYVSWQEKNMLDHPILLAVNISVQHLYYENFLTSTQQIIQETGMSPKNLELELTETAIITDIEYAITILQKINKLGIKLTIDDFGSGYTSLSYIDRLPISRLKIDKSFIENMLDEEARLTIIESIINLAHKINLKVVVEGIETMEQLSYLTDINCDAVQGYYLSKPLDSKETENLLRAQK